MLGALSLKWKWRQRREAAGKPTDKPEPRLRRRRPRRLGEVLPLLRRRAADRAAAAGQVHDRPRGHRAARRREHDRRRGRGRHHLHRPRRRRRRDQRPAGRASKDEKGLDVPLHIDGASGAFVWPFLYPRLEVGLPARAGSLDQRLRAQVRPGLPGDRLADLPREVRPRRGPRLLRELPGQDRRDLHPQLLDRLLDGARPVLQLRPLRQGGLSADHGDHAGERRGARQPTSPASASSRSSARARRRCRWSPSTSPRSTPTTSSTSPSSSPPSAAGWCPPTRCRRTPRT